MSEATKPAVQSGTKPPAAPAASIVVLNYNGRDLLPACLAPTLAQAAAIGAEVIVVDNGSSDGSIELVRREFPAIRLVEAGRNLGFAAGCNAGARLAASDTIVLLNNDAVPAPGWLDALLATLAEPNVGVVCSVVHEREYPEEYALGTGSLSVIGHPIARAMWRWDHPFYATGASLAFRRSTRGEPFVALLFAYYEDVLLSWELRLRGLTVARALDSHVEHLGSATARRTPTRAFALRERNKLVTLLLCYERATLARLLPLYCFDGLVRLAEDVGRSIRRLPPGQAGAPPLLTKYDCLLRGIGWLLLHFPELRRLRARIQAGRTVPDDEILERLSGKIFDDVIPSRTHTVANRLALAYCRLLAIPTVEHTPPRTSSPNPRSTESR